MAYEPKTWECGEYITNDSLNHMEDGIAQASAQADSVSTRLATAENDIDVLDARMDTFASLPNGSTTADAELIDIRVGADGTTYPSAGDAVRGQVSDLKSDIKQKTNAEKNGYYDVVPLDWESGSINYPGGSDKNPDVNVIRTPLPRVQLTGNIKFILLNNKYRIRYYTFPDLTSAGTNQSNWYNAIGTYSIDIDTTKYYRIQIATNTATAMDVEEALNSILVVYDSDAIDYVKNDVIDLINATLPFEWESGSIVYTNGGNSASTSSIRTRDARFYSTSYHVVVKDNNLRVGAYRYSSDGTYDNFYYAWIPTTKEESNIEIDTTKRYRFVISTVDGSDINAEEAIKNILFVPIENLSYWYDYIVSKTALVNDYMTDGIDKTAFLFLTDTHYNRNPFKLNSKGINGDLMKYFVDNTNIRYCIHGGDLNSEMRSNKAEARKLMTQPMAVMRDAFDHVLITRGNHDDNNESGNLNWGYTISQSDSYSYMFRNTKNVVFGETGTYFYHDIPFENVRIISLDCVDFPYTNDVDATLLDEKILAYGYTQLQWFCDVLKNTPDNYHIIIYTHAMIAPSAVTVDYPSTSPQTRAKNAGVVARILQAYKNRENFSLDITGWFTSVHQTYFDGVLADDFRNCSANIVGVFSGHEHIDCIEEIESNGTGIGIYNTCTQNSSEMFGDSVISHSYQHPMEINTTTELVWDVVVIDRAEKHVDMIRIGANGANTDIDEFNVRSFDYE